MAEPGTGQVLGVWGLVGAEPSSWQDLSLQLLPRDPQRPPPLSRAAIPVAQRQWPQSKHGDLALQACDGGWVPFPVTQPL